MSDREDRIYSIEEMWLSPLEMINCSIDPGLLPVGGLMIVTGEPGVGKSFLVQQMGFEIATGRRILNIFPTKRNKTTYFELEKMSEIARRRFKGLSWQQEYANVGNNLGYYDSHIPSLSTPLDIIKFRGLLRDYGCKVAIMDSYSVMIDDIRDLQEQKKLIVTYREIAKEEGMSFILVQHLKKRQQVFDRQTKTVDIAPLTIDDLMGFKTVVYEADTIVGLVKGKHRHTRQLIFLKHSHCPYHLDEEEPLEFIFDGKSSKPLALSEKYLSSIISITDQMGPTSFSDMEAAIEISRPTLIKYVERLLSFGLIEVEQEDGKKYIVPTHY